MRAVKLGTSWCQPPSDAVIGDTWTCPECAEHWTAVEVGAPIPGVPAEPGVPTVFWSQTWELDAHEEDQP